MHVHCVLDLIQFKKISELLIFPDFPTNECHHVTTAGVLCNAEESIWREEGNQLWYRKPCDGYWSCRSTCRAVSNLNWYGNFLTVYEVAESHTEHKKAGSVSLGQPFLQLHFSTAASLSRSKGPSFQERKVSLFCKEFLPDSHYCDCSVSLTATTHTQNPQILCCRNYSWPLLKFAYLSSYCSSLLFFANSAF